MSPTWPKKVFMFCKLTEAPYATLESRVPRYERRPGVGEYPSLTLGIIRPRLPYFRHYKTENSLLHFPPSMSCTGLCHLTACFGCYNFFAEASSIGNTTYVAKSGLSSQETLWKCGSLRKLLKAIFLVMVFPVFVPGKDLSHFCSLIDNYSGSI